MLFRSLKNVASVKALFDVENIVNHEVGKQVVKDVPLRAYDKEGNIVDVEIVPSKIDVTVDIASPSKEVPIRIIPTGNIAFGKAISSLESSVSKVLVYGEKNFLDNLTMIPVKIDVTDLKSNKVYKVDMECLLASSIITVIMH